MICIDSTHRRIYLALRNRTLDLVPPDRLRYATVVTLSQNRAIVLPLRNWLNPKRPFCTAIICLRLMDTCLFGLESTLLTLGVPPLLHPSRRRNRPSRSSSPALEGKDLLPAVVGSPRTTIEDPPGTEDPKECEGNRLESSTWT